MRLGPLICASLLLASAAGLTPQTKGAVERVAIICEANEFAPVADLLTVELSALREAEVLERVQMERLYREQALAAANRDFLALGKVLGADGLLLLGKVTEGTNQYVGLRLIAVQPGVVIGSERGSWPLSDAPGWTRGAAGRLERLLPKLAVRASEAVPLSVVNLRSAVRSARAEDTERQLTALGIASSLVLAGPDARPVSKMFHQGLRAPVRYPAPQGLSVTAQQVAGLRLISSSQLPGVADSSMNAPKDTPDPGSSPAAES